MVELPKKVTLTSTVHGAMVPRKEGKDEEHIEAKKNQLIARVISLFPSYSEKLMNANSFRENRDIP